VSDNDLLTFRRATHEDLPVIVGLYADDDKGGHGDAWNETNRPAYEAAFEEIVANPRDALMVIEQDGTIVGTFLLTLLPGLTGLGTRRLELRSVEVRADMRSLGIGAHMLAFVEDYAKAHGAAQIELTSNNTRLDAHRFYERNGYTKSHAGFKKKVKA
jgi:GNAT superfamily N-acetyltransferase